MHDASSRVESNLDALPFLTGPLPSAFRRRRVELHDGYPRPFHAGEWRDALVVVGAGRLDLECHLGRRRSFPAGSVLHLDEVALRALHGGGPEPTVLIAVHRRRPVHPRIIELPERPYLGVRDACSDTTMHIVADRIPEIIGHVLGRGVAPDGPPFLRYHRCGPGDIHDAEAGVPVTATAGLTTATIRARALPAGRYAVVRHHGSFDELPAVTEELLAWAEDHAQTWDRHPGAGGELWGARVEHFLTNPAEEPDPRRQVVELAFRLADD